MHDAIYEIPRKLYPKTLLQEKYGPRKLYARGTFKHSPETKYLCVIGARHFTQYGRDVVDRLIEGLRGYPIVIVSGLALGIDSLAHKAAMAANLKTIAFPGSTLEWGKIAPSQHEGLAHDIINSGGTLLSPWKVGYQTGSWSFPARNRLMAALSHATLIIEAAKGSGTLITAKHALQLDRDVLVVPGSIFAGNSYGPHDLMRDGATCITSSADILEALGFHAVNQPSRFERLVKTLSTDTQRVAAIVARGEYNTSQLSELLPDMSIQNLQVNISELEMLGLIRVTPAGIKLV